MNINMFLNVLFQEQFDHEKKLLLHGGFYIEYH